MEQSQTVVSFSHFQALSALHEQDQGMPVERLPFTVRRVQDDNDLRKAVHIRHAAYARHLPEFAQTLALPETCDYDSDVVVLLAESKLDGSALGTMRIQTNWLQPLSVEESVTLPAWLGGRRLAEVTRLGINVGRVGRLVKLALFKAFFEYCEQNDIEWAVVTGRPPIDLQYEQLLFVDIFPGMPHVPLQHVGNIAHRVMAFEIASAQARWEQANHPMLAFFRHTRHPDIHVESAGVGYPNGAMRHRPAHAEEKFSTI